MSTASFDAELEILRRGTTEIISEEDLVAKLRLGRPLRIKLGVDPTAAHVTLGWGVVLRKLRDFQRLGHTACLIIGDFTSLIGDPSGKSKTRKQLSREEVQANVEAVSRQFYKILDPDKTEFHYNKDWLGAMTFEDVISLASRYTVARIMERDDFTKRWNENRPIAMHEILYPLCQGMDSVHIRADVELGGNDQMFNILVGRSLMREYGQEPQVVMLSPLLVGTDGREKMSQSLGNYISIVDAPRDMFGKTMSIPDDIIANWFELCTDVPLKEVQEMLAPGCNPRDAKIRLAKEIVALYHDVQAAEAEERYFIETFSRKAQPVEAEEAVIPADLVKEGIVSLPGLAAALGLAKSSGAARDLLKAGAISLDGERIESPQMPAGELVGKILKVGKHQFRRIAGIG